MDATGAEVTPCLLSWARRRRGVEASDLAKKLEVSPETVAGWERGDKMPTFRQAQRLVRALYVPFGYLYLREPPVEKVPLADFRAAGTARPGASPDLLDLLHDTLGKQQWLREHRESVLLRTRLISANGKHYTSWYSTTMSDGRTPVGV